MGNLPDAFLIRTFGCQMNERDSEIMADLLERAGLRRAQGLPDAGIVILNTCHIRDHAVGRVLSMLGRLKEWKNERPGRLLVLAGCVAEARGSGIRERFHYLDVVMGPSRLLELPNLIARAREGDLPQIATGHEDAVGVPETADRSVAGVKAWVKIMEGCDHGCTFCVVPKVRGRERHRPFDEIVAEAERLAAAGVRELGLLGQTVNAYGRKDGPERDFAALLRRLSKVAGIRRIRFTSPHPAHMNGAVIAAMAECPPVCAHLHLPVQSGSDRMLRLMARGHTAAHYLEILGDARARIPGLAVTTDLIVGFPGETEEDFAATLDLVRAADFQGAFTFAYSSRPGTHAAGMPDQVTAREKSDRLARLNAALDGLSRRHNEGMVGKTAEVLAEGPAPSRPGSGAVALLQATHGRPSRPSAGLACAPWQGRLESNVLVNFPPREGLAPGDLVTIEIMEAGTWSLTGKLVEPGGVRS
jgi:tRNA-2-methylthio-N6-dimethylallyladenosine synthase